MRRRLTSGKFDGLGREQIVKFYEMSIIYSWSKEFLQAGKKRLAGGTDCSATSDEVKALQRESRDLKEAISCRHYPGKPPVQKSMIRDGAATNLISRHRKT
ncbi:hypothetical protein [Rhizobium sp. C4]|uniref:hypothetical protein n=1 Tax=Rhizobium sp. C4 TaxID=1349800 RepID=UPI001E32ED79|nr:hypothetical protein [Rhizobium sp. C4]MCD2172051.1 hypothetical protein [Rhizobium sp. C4]